MTITETRTDPATAVEASTPPDSKVLIGLGYLDAFTGSAASGWIVLTIITGLALAGTVATLHHRS